MKINAFSAPHLVWLLLATMLLSPLACGKQKPPDGGGPSPKSVEMPVEPFHAGKSKTGARTGGKSLKPVRFVHDPQAVSAEKLMQEYYLIGRKAFEKKYKDQLLTVEGRVALIRPWFRADRFFLYGFTQENFTWMSSAFPLDVTRFHGFVSYSTGSDDFSIGRGEAIAKLKHGQRVRVRAKYSGSGFVDAKLLAVGLEPDGDPTLRPVESKQEFETQADRCDAISKQLEKLKADVDTLAGRNEIERIFGKRVKLVPENFTPDGQIKPDVFNLLKQIPRLQLAVEETKMSDVGLKQIGTLSNLLALRFKYTDGVSKRVTPEGLSALKALTELRHLEIDRDGFVDDRIKAGPWLSELQTLTKLEYLDLSGLQFGNADTGLLSKLKRLRVLKLENSDISDGGLPDWSQLPALRELDLSRTSVSSAGMKGIENCRDLRYVYLQSTQVDDRTVESLGKSPFLRFLRLSDTKVGGSGMKSFEKHQFLEHVYLERTAVGDAEMKVLASLPKLVLLSIRSTKVTDAGLLAFQNRSNEITIYCSKKLISDDARRQLMRKRVKARVERK